jgi:YD repeat-containing protein
MKHSFIVRSLIGVCMLTLIFSCRKRGDFEVPCKLLKMSYVERGAFPSPQEEYTGNVTYNAWGDPAQIIWTLTATGRPNYFFNYDNKHRLIRFDAAYSPTNIETVKLYFYQGDKIVSDSNWYYVSDGNNFRGTALIKSATKYSYDAKGRISKIEETTHTGTPFILNYTYDAAGNMIREGVTYDNKKSFLRTNAWLMFVVRDFSMSNPKLADEYNKKGLPLTYQNTALTFFNAYVNEFEYSCDHKNH